MQAYEVGDIVRLLHRETQGWLLCKVDSFEELEFSKFGREGTVGMKLLDYVTGKVWCHYCTQNLESTPAHLWLECVVRVREDHAKVLKHSKDNKGHDYIDHNSVAWHEANRFLKNATNNADLDNVVFSMCDSEYKLHVEHANKVNCESSLVLRKKYLTQLVFDTCDVDLASAPPSVLEAFRFAIEVVGPSLRLVQFGASKRKAG